MTTDRSELRPYLAVLLFRRRDGEYDIFVSVAELKSCIVSYQDHENIRHSVEVTAETLYEAAALGLKALKVPLKASGWLAIDIKVKSPETTHTVSGSALKEWLARQGKNPKEIILKTRLRQLLQVET